MKPERYVMDVDPGRSRATTAAAEHRCRDCSAVIPVKPGDVIVPSRCDVCETALARALQAKMMETGHVGGWPLYWSGEQFRSTTGPVERWRRCDRWVAERGKISPFHSKVTWPVTYVSLGRHNIAGRQYRLYWRLPDGKLWTGVVFGDHTQLVRSARVLKHQS